MCVNYFLREKAFHFQFDEQFALEKRKDSDSVTVVEEIIQDGDRLECVVCAGLVTRLRCVEFSLNREALFFFRPTKRILPKCACQSDGQMIAYCHRTSRIHQF